MPKLLTTKDLDVMLCGEPDCTHESHEDVLYVHGRCHLASALYLKYDKTMGAMIAECATCRSEVARIAVAQGVR